MKIISIRTTKGSLTIKYENPNPNNPDHTDVVTITSEDDPRPELFTALDELVSPVLEILEFDSSYGDGLTVTGVMFSEKKSREFATISCKKTLINSNAPLNLCTPTKPLASTGEEATGEDDLPEDCVAALAELRDEARRFIRGERMQEEIDFSGGSEEDEGEEEESGEEG